MALSQLQATQSAVSITQCFRSRHVSERFENYLCAGGRRSAHAHHKLLRFTTAAMPRRQVKAPRPAVRCTRISAESQQVIPTPRLLPRCPRQSLCPAGQLLDDCATPSQQAPQTSRREALASFSLAAALLVASPACAGPFGGLSKEETYKEDTVCVELALC